jgi:hypothetical protein
MKRKYKVGAKLKIGDFNKANTNYSNLHSGKDIKSLPFLQIINFLIRAAQNSKYSQKIIVPG